MQRTRGRRRVSLRCAQAVCFLETGRTYVPPKPWSQDDEAKWVGELLLLSPEVQQLVQRFAAEAAGSEGGEASGGGGAAAAC